MFGTVIFIVIGVLLAGLLMLWPYGERGHFLRGSSWTFLKQAGIRRILNGSALHAYVYGRWLKEYLNLLLYHILPRLGPKGKKWLSGHYHGKVLTPEHAHTIITLDRDIPLLDLEQIIPYPMARNLVLKGPPDVAFFQCGCRRIRDNPCQPIQVCMVIGQPFVDFILDRHPTSSRRLTQIEALELLKAEYKRGHLHSAWFKDVMLDHFYAICNWCKCCCGGIEAMVKHDAPAMVSSGCVARVDEGNCATCGTCVDACPFDALSLDGTSKVNWEKCMGCGV